MSTKGILKMMLPLKWRQNIRESFVSMKVTHLHGPKNIRLSGNEAAVTCIAKNGEFYMEQFIRHYTQMGFRHIFILDNGSSDQTISIGKRHENVSICQTNLPIDTYETLFKKYIAQQSVKGGWCLDADMDEFFDYPYSNIIGLREFLEYLNNKQYTAVITHILDMFSDNPASHLSRKQEENLKEVYQYYDISNITKVKYNKSDIVAKYGNRNESSSGNEALFYGGIRKTLYGNNCLLTKHSLFLQRKELNLFPHGHFINNAKLADVSCVIFHYKLTSNALDIARQNKAGFVGTSKGYEDFISFIMKNPDFTIKRDTAVKFRSVNELIQNDFLYTSEEYIEYIKALNKGINLLD